jgi:hypothetical protein
VRRGGAQAPRLGIGVLALGVSVLAAAPASGRPVNVPLRLDHSFIRQALIDQIYESADKKVSLWDNGTGCSFLRLWDPQVSSVGNRLRLVSRGEGRVGTPVGDSCLAPVQWEGLLEVLEEPQIAPDGNAVTFRVVDSNLYDAEGHKPFFTGKLWDFVKAPVQERFGAVRLDIAPPIRDLRELLPLVVHGGDAERAQQLVDSLRLTRVDTTPTGLTVIAAFDVSPLPRAAVPTPEPTLSAEELQRWDAASQQWDAFLTFVVKQLGRDTPLSELHRALAEALLDGRYDLLEALAPTEQGAPDPVPALFVKTWERLVPIIRQSSAAQPSAVALRYLSFIAAGDALAALQEMGPDMGLDISADGLRRMARIVAPQSTEDPLAFSNDVDPELRDLMGFGPPLPPPELPDEPGSANVSWWWQLVGTRPASATGEASPPTNLERWLPEREQLDGYLQAVRQVLDDATAQTIGKTPLTPPQENVYRRLVLATAWQETCWRQFVREGGAVTYIHSPVGAVGMMQINERVWRGVYDLRGLRWDIRYNGRAGAEILVHYLTDYAVARKEQTQPGGIDNLARAAYAVYNGGPAHLARYRKPSTPRALRRIDDLFWAKYQAVTAGREAEVSRCIVGG